MSSESNWRAWDRAWRAQAERKFEAAVELWSDYIEQHPQVAGGYANRCICLLSLVRSEEALRDARKAYELLPAPGNRVALMQALDANGLFDEMNELSKEQEQEEPDDFFTLNFSGRAAQETGDFAKAEERFLEVVNIHPGANFAWTQLGDIYLRTGRYTEALDAWGKAQASVHDRPGPPEWFQHQALLGMGWSLLWLEKPKRALILAEQAERLNVDVASAQGLKARCLLATDHPSGANVAENAFRLGYQDDFLRARLAMEYARLARREDAERCLAPISPHPDDTYTRNLIAGTLTYLGRTDEAIQELEGLDGKLEPYVRYNALASAFRIAGRPDKAEEMSLKALEIRRDEVILTNLGSFYNEESRHEEAEEVLKESLGLRPNMPDTLYQLGYSYAAQGKEGQARKYLRQILRSEMARESLKEEAADMLARMNQNAELEADRKEYGIIGVYQKEIEQIVRRSERQDTLRYEQECARLAKEPQSGLGWSGVETQRVVRHAGSQREIDVYGSQLVGEQELLNLGECKFKTSNTVGYSEVRELVEKMALVRCVERHGHKREVSGYMFSTVSYDNEARELAAKHGIRLFTATPQKGWQKRADWTVTNLKE